MKIEKLNENQIRCTLNKDDLAKRQIKLSELAYGSDKAKRLFRDMMIQASTEVGFEANDIPLVIEAIPVSSDCIVLIVTKVEDPEELDTRFANFAPSVHESSESSSPIEQLIQSLSSDAENVLDLFKKYRQATNNDEAVASDNTIKEASQGFEITKIFSFEKLSDVISVAKLLSKFYAGENALYKSKKSGKLILVIHKSHHTPEDFNKVCNIISEYGVAEKYTEAYASYLEENGDTIIGEHALLTLAVV